MVDSKYLASRKGRKGKRISLCMGIVKIVADAAQGAQVSALGTEVAQLRAEVDAQRMALAAIAAERDAARSSAADSSQRLKACFSHCSTRTLQRQERILATIPCLNGSAHPLLVHTFPA